jgi:hypothetical protein
MGGFVLSANFREDLSKNSFDNLALTMAGAWLDAGKTAVSPRFDTLAGDARSGFGRAPHANWQNRRWQTTRYGA